MARPVPLFVELCAGTAALSLRLHRAGARPPVSRLGSKQGYADAILQVLGLQPGQGAERFLWCEPDDGTRLLLHTYGDHLLAEQAATHLRGWHGEPALELWEGLRDEGPFACPAAPDPREAARYVWIEGRQLQDGGFAREQAATHKRQADRVTAKAHAAEVGREIARARERLGMTRAQVSSAVLGRPTGACWNWEHGAPVSEDVWPAVRDLLGLGHLDEKVIGGTVITLRPIPNAKTWTVKLRSCSDFADRLDRLPVLPAEVHTDARRLDPARWGSWPRARSATWIRHTWAPRSTATTCPGPRWWSWRWPGPTLGRGL